VAWQTIAGDLTSADGATLTITPLTARTWRLFGLFRTNLTTSAVVTVTLYDNPSTLVFTDTMSTMVAGYGQVVLDAGQDYTADYCVIEIDDATNPDTFINVPLAYAGPGWLPGTGLAWQTTFGRDSQVDEVRSKGGQEYPTHWWSRRRWDIFLAGVNASEVWTEAMELDRISRFGRNVLFVPDVTSATLAYEMLLGRLEVVSDVSYVDGIVDYFTWRFRVRERL